MIIQSFRLPDSSLIIIIDSLSVDFLRTLLFGEWFHNATPQILEFSPFAFLIQPLLSSLTPYQSTFFEPPLRIWSRVLPSPSLFGELFHNTTPINMIIQSFRLKFFDPLLTVELFHNLLRLSFLAWFCFAPRIFHSASPSVLSRVQLKFFDPYQSTFFEPWRWIWISFFRKFFAPSVNNQPEDSFYGVLNEPQILWAFVANSLRLLSLFNDLWSFIRKFFAPLFFFTGPSH